MLIALKSHAQYLSLYEASIIIILTLQQNKIILGRVTVTSSYKQLMFELGIHVKKQGNT